MADDLDGPFTQTALARVVGVTQPAISALMSEGKLESAATLGEGVIAYCARLRETAAGRAPAEGELDPIQEKAALDRERRMGQRIKNYVALGLWAPIALLTKVLAAASAAVVAKLDALPGEMLKHAPAEMSDELTKFVREYLAGVRNDWATDTSSLEAAELVDEDAVDDDEGADD